MKNNNYKISRGRRITPRTYYMTYICNKKILILLELQSNDMMCSMCEISPFFF